MWASTAPDAITALVQLWSNALPGVTVLDGPQVMASGVLEGVVVGFQSEDNPLAVEHQIDLEGMAAQPDRDRYTVNCLIRVRNGSRDIVAARARAYELLAAAGEALAVKRRLVEGVLRASVSEGGLSQSQSRNGAEAAVAFTVQVDAYTNR